ncbi:MAG: hypothetical protein AAGG38_03475 [Planctomycetota bacterium]
MLINEWDPIGVGDEPLAHDEYDSYIPVIYRLITEGADEDKIARHLKKLETISMGVRSSGDHNRTIAQRLKEAV